MLQGQDVFNDPHTCTPSPSRTHTPGFQMAGHTYTLPTAHYLNLPLHLPLTLSSCPPPFNSLLPHHLSATALSSPPPVLSPHLLLTCSPQVGSPVVVRGGSPVSNSPGDAGLLTFRCTLSKGGFFSILAGVTPHWL